MATIIEEYSKEEDLVGGMRKGPFSDLREKLWELGVMVLPDPHNGFCDSDDEGRYREILKRRGINIPPRIPSSQLPEEKIA